MLRLMRACGVLIVGGLASAACTIKTPEEPNTGAGGSPSTTKPDDTPAKAGRSSTAGKGPVADDDDDDGAAGASGGDGSITPPKDDDPPTGPQCDACDNGVCLDDGTCVACLPTDDRCETGFYCTAENTCAPGCKSDDACASGVCGDDHNCKKCINDSECAEGFLCSSGQCTLACTSDGAGQSSACGAELSCCSARCADLNTDGSNCGACGVSCDAGQFCGLSECRDATFANVCSVAKVVVILDTNRNTEDGDRAPGQAIGNALSQQCPTQPGLLETMQNSAEALNLTTGRPVSNSSELLVIAGGPFFQDLEGYLEKQRVSPLYWSGSADTTGYRVSKTDRVVVSMPIDADHESRDAFIIQFMRDPDSGSLVLNAQGLWLSGTIAAGYQVTNGLLPNLAQQDQAWYAYEWTDQDGDKAPDADEIVLVDSGT